MSFVYDHTQFASRIDERDSRGEFERFYIPRIEMPQIDDDDRLIAALREKFGHVEIAEVDVRTLHQHQRVNMNRKLEATIPESTMRKSIVISADNFVVDGNHRYRAHLDRREYDVKAIRIPLSFADALNWLSTQDFVTHSAPQTRGE